MIKTSHIYITYSFLRKTNFYNKIYIKKNNYIFSLLYNQYFYNILNFISKQYYYYDFIYKN